MNMKKSLSIIGLDYHYIYPDGRIFTKDRRVAGRYGCTRLLKGKEIFPHITGNGYYHFGARVGDKLTGFGLHRTLALAFIPNPNNLPVVHHKDGNKLNNKLDNLEWSTHLNNIRHAYKTGLSKRLKGIHSVSAKLDFKKAAEIIALVNESKLSYKEIGKMFNVCGSTVNDVLRGRVWNNNRKFSVEELEDFIECNNIISTSELIKLLKETYGK